VLRAGDVDEESSSGQGLRTPADRSLTCFDESLPSERDQVRGALDLLARREPSDPDPDRRLRFFLCLVLPRRRERSLTSVLAGTPTAQTGEHSRDHSKQRPAYRTAVPAQRLIAQLVSKQFFDPGPKSLSFAD